MAKRMGLAERVVKPKGFQIRISDCGLDTLHGTYKKLEDDDALKLALRVVNILTNDFVGREREAHFKYCIAAYLLAHLKFPTEELERDLKEPERHIGKWKLVNEDRSARAVTKNVAQK